MAFENFPHHTVAKLSGITNQARGMVYGFLNYFPRFLFVFADGLFFDWMLCNIHHIAVRIDLYPGFVMESVVALSSTSNVSRRNTRRLLNFAPLTGLVDFRMDLGQIQVQFPFERA